ncbi:uncharacterized protein [Littorina saxatilis]|uniref:uncharacterized protein isoform X2 n=1 Tax=Littorina saxatilis TaxID=31220 RepID=UPI0038B5486C
MVGRSCLEQRAMSLIYYGTTMASAPCCRIALLLVTATVFPVLVYGQQLLTIAVATPGNTTETTIYGTSQFSLGNDSTPNVTVLWTHVNLRNPFRVAQLMEELDRRNVDLLILPDDISTSVTATTAFKPLNSTPVEYSQVEEEEKKVDKIKSLCYSDLEIALQSTPVPEVKCNGSKVMVSEVEALAVVIEGLEWTPFLILHEESQEMTAKDLTDRLSTDNTKKQLLMYSLKGLDLNNVTSASDDGRSLYEVVETLYDIRDGELRVVLLCSVQCVKQVLTAASSFDHLNGKKTAMAMISRWLLVLPPNDQQILESCNLELDNVAVIVHPPDTLRPPVKDIEKEMENILLKAYSSVLENNITLSGFALSEAIRQSLQVPEVCYKSDVKTLLWKSEGRRLSDVGHVAHDGQLHVGEGQEIFPNIKFGLNNRTFVVATLPWPAFVERTEDGGYEGLCVDLLNQLKVNLNFSYVWAEPEDKQWGSTTENGTWTGLIGLLERQEVDMVVAPISIQAEREKVMDFVYPFFVDYTTVLLKLPDPADSKWRTLIQPFQTTVHMYIWISLLGVTLITHTLEYFNPYYATNTKSMLHIGDMFWYMFGALLTQGGAILPDSQTGRTMVSIFWLFSIIMAAIYGGNLIASLTVSKDKAPFETLLSMVEQDVYTWGTPGGTFWVTLFESSSIDVFQKVWAGIQRELASDPDVLALDPAVHLAKVKAGHYAYIGDKSAISTWLKSECDLLTIKEEFLPLQYAIGMVNNSAYTNMVSEEMLYINEIGLIDTWERKWWSKTSFCKGSLTTESTVISLIDVQSAFFLVFIGITLALLVLVTEKLSHRFHFSTRLREFFCKKKQQRDRRSSVSAAAVVVSADGVRIRARPGSTLRREWLRSSFRKRAERRTELSLCGLAYPPSCTDFGELSTNGSVSISRDLDLVGSGNEDQLERGSVSISRDLDLVGGGNEDQLERGSVSISRDLELVGGGYEDKLEQDKLEQNKLERGSVSIGTDLDLVVSGYEDKLEQDKLECGTYYTYRNQRRKNNNGDGDGDVRNKNIFYMSGSPVGERKNGFVCNGGVSESTLSSNSAAGKRKKNFDHADITFY